ncbi:MAG: hypothetical protein IRY92_01545, partial [Dactylosporangium sp.]|nr:hypothetical protein [Dactylosporangium sp.]
MTEAADTTRAPGATDAMELTKAATGADARVGLRAALALRRLAETLE